MVSYDHGITGMAPGTLEGIQMVVPDAEAACEHLLANGVEASEVRDYPWGRFVWFTDPDGNGGHCSSFRHGDARPCSTPLDGRTSAPSHL